MPFDMQNVSMNIIIRWIFTLNSNWKQEYGKTLFVWINGLKLKLNFKEKVGNCSQVLFHKCKYRFSIFFTRFLTLGFSLIIRVHFVYILGAPFGSFFINWEQTEKYFFTILFPVGTNLPLVFAPENGNMLGGTQVNLTGPCFPPGSHVTCR